MLKDSSALCTGAEPYSCVLLLAGIELMFLIVASMGLWMSGEPWRLTQHYRPVFGH